MTTATNDVFPACCRFHLLLLVCLSGCAPQFSAPGATPLAQPGHLFPAIEAESFTSFDGVKLPMHRWLPAGKPDAIVLALHGFNDYSLFISDAAHYFAQHGVAVYAYDQRGFGQSANRGRWPGKDTLATDTQAFIQALRARYPHTPVFLFGHSMGAAVALHALHSKTLDVDGVILAAPAISGWSIMPWWQRWGLKLAAHTIPWKTFTGQSLNIVASDNREMLLALGRDPLVIKQTRVDTIYGLVNLMESAYHATDQISVPALILYGEKDQIVPQPVILDRFGPLATRNKAIRLQLYKNGYHMLLRDLQAEVVWRDIIAWIHHHHAPLPSQRTGLSRAGQ